MAIQQPISGEDQNDQKSQDYQDSFSDLSRPVHDAIRESDNWHSFYETGDQELVAADSSMGGDADYALVIEKEETGDGFFEYTVRYGEPSSVYPSELEAEEEFSTFCWDCAQGKALELLGF